MTFGIIPPLLLINTGVEYWILPVVSGFPDSAGFPESRIGLAKGSYAFATSPPGVYPGRPPKIHFKVSVPGHKPLTTRPHLRGGEKGIRFDMAGETGRRY